MVANPFDRPGPLYFVSDAHLGASEGPRERAAWLVEFLEGLSHRIAGLFIVGDLFDFWFEYRHAVPKQHFRVLRALAALTGAGVPVLYFGGNHDFWAGSYLREEVGISVSEGPVSLVLQGRRVFVAHGDGLGRGDSGYKVLRRILRNKACISLYRAVHPDLGIPFAYRVSAISRRHTEPREVLIPKLVRDIAAPRIAAGAEIVIIGHIHEPTHLRLPGGEFLILGDWIRNFTYAVLEDGRIRHYRYRPGGEPELLPAEATSGT